MIKNLFADQFLLKFLLFSLLGPTKKKEKKIIYIYIYFFFVAFTENTTILEQQNNKQKWLILEALYIRKKLRILKRINF